jgi:hypothetical protein
MITRVLYDFVGSHEPRQEEHPNKKKNYFVGDNGKLVEDKNSSYVNKKKKHHKKRVVDTSGCPSILSFTFQEL